MDPIDEVLERRVGRTIGGHWTLRRLIGAGGMAAVYAADEPGGTRAALKLLHPEMGTRSDIRERFLREAAVMQQLVHPGMVTIYEHGVDADTAFLAMELLEGEVISARVRRLGRLPPDEVVNLLDQILDVLVVAHAKGVIHRDLKPDNLFLTRDGRVKVLDFGLARLLYDGPSSFRTRTGAALGTLPYMAPEQALGRRDDIDARTDLFAVGATAFRLLSGRRIHDAPSDAELLMAMASEPAAPLSSVAPDVPSPLALVVDRSLFFAKRDRYPDASVMQRDVRDVIAGNLPSYAVSQSHREQCATRIDRIPIVDSARFNAISTTTPDARSALANSTDDVTQYVPSKRPIAATVVMPAPLSPPGSAPNSAAAPTASMNAGALAQQGPSSFRHPAEPTVTDCASHPSPSPVALFGVKAAVPAFHGTFSAEPRAIPVAPVSHAAVAQRRKRTMITGLMLLGFLLVVTTTLAYVLFTPHSTKQPSRPMPVSLHEGKRRVTEQTPRVVIGLCGDFVETKAS